MGLQDYVTDVKQTSSELKQSSAELKHNLGDVYAIEEGLGSSASKPRMSVENNDVDEDGGNN
ncbi:hypothetical protein Hanom_Chr17g01555461 [Helianthus anomalus]